MNNQSNNQSKNITPSTNLTWLKYAAFGAGGAACAYALWVNRARIQSFVKAQSTAVPALAANIGEVVKASVAKLAGAADREIDRAENDIRAAV